MVTVIVLSEGMEDGKWAQKDDSLPHASRLTAGLHPLPDPIRPITFALSPLPTPVTPAPPVALEGRVPIVCRWDALILPDVTVGTMAWEPKRNKKTRDDRGAWLAHVPALETKTMFQTPPQASMRSSAFIYHLQLL